MGRGRGIIVWAIYTTKDIRGESVLGARRVVEGSVNDGRGGSMLRARGLVERIDSTVWGTYKAIGRFSEARLLE